MTKNLLVELGLEELPAYVVTPSEKQLGEKMAAFLDVRSQTFQSVSDLRSYRTRCQSTNLLEVGELSDFHTVQPNFPT